MKVSATVAALLLCAPALALAQMSSSPMQGMDMKGATDPATIAYMKEMEGMQETMRRMTPANDPNKDFVMMMKPHHQAAVEMAQTYLKYGNDPVLKKMAGDIIASQEKEIAEMSAWQQKHSN